MLKFSREHAEAIDNCKSAIEAAEKLGPMPPKEELAKSVKELESFFRQRDLDNAKLKKELGKTWQEVEKELKDKLDEHKTITHRLSEDRKYPFQIFSRAKFTKSDRRAHLQGLLGLPMRESILYKLYSWLCMTLY